MLPGDTIMRKNTMISILLSCLLILCSFPVMIQPAVARGTPDWNDGQFQGTWKERDGNNSGSLHGSLNHGRRATYGSFLGEWGMPYGTESGQIKGYFRGRLLLGQYSSAITKQTIHFIGILQVNDTNFYALILCRQYGIIDIAGTHEASFLPQPTGSYGMGAKKIHLIDTDRPENFTTNDTTDVREVMIQVWYPIDVNSTEPRTDYMDAPTFQWLKGRSPIPLVTIPNDAYLFVRPHAKNQTAISPGAFPVVVFSPGYDGVYQIYTSFIEDLVSHGLVVVSINHPYVSGITVFPDGRTVGLAEVPTDPVARAAFYNMSLRTIVEDAKFVLNTVTALNEIDPVFSGHFDLSKVGMYGHSFGGANTAVCCLEDHRFRAGLTLDGVFYQQFIPGDITVPFLMMFAEKRLADDETIAYMWNHTTNDTLKMSIKGSTHYAFTDVGVLLSHLVPLVPPRLLGFGSIPPKRMVNITKTYVTMFFEVYLKGEPFQNLLNLTSYFPEVQLEYKIG
jgi:hypothetical protein